MPDPDSAATVLLLREGMHGAEVLMVERNSRGFFGNMVVFPGGGVDDCDIPPGLTAAADASHRVAAIRELAEETGILLTTTGPRSAPARKGPDFHRWVQEHHLVTSTDALVLVSRWVTPLWAPRRFDTRFYLATCEHEPEVVIDSEELTNHFWIRPGEALARHANGAMNLILPTLSHLRWLDRRSSIDDALTSARGADGRTVIRPEKVEDGSWLPIHMPVEPA